ncbi:MAG: hypothetical protein JJ863_02805 [Deltaproteobacteria bacterium]|nr:hypothetical protein [Deltaproteobacteria bacterium]
MRFALPFFAAFVLLASACSDEGGGSGFMSACFVDSDCADGFVCAEGGPSDQPYCTLECSAVNDPCEERFGDRAYCAAGAFNCRVRCDSDSDCPGDSVCPDICRVP